MHQYRVLEVQAAEGLLTLQCSAGQQYVVRALGRVPPLGTVLHGVAPHSGFDILACPRSRQLYRVIFEAASSPEPAPDAVWAAAALSAQRAPFAYASRPAQ
jgi:hypothetical protein